MVQEEIEKQGKTRLVKIAKVFTNLLLKLGIDIRRKVFKDIIDGLGGLRFVISGAAALDKKKEGIGKFVFRAPNIMHGYYEDEGATKAVMKDGWFYTNFILEHLY